MKRHKLRDWSEEEYSQLLRNAGAPEVSDMELFTFFNIECDNLAQRGYGGIDGTIDTIKRPLWQIVPRKQKPPGLPDHALPEVGDSLPGSADRYLDLLTFIQWEDIAQKAFDNYIPRSPFGGALPDE